ncbi:MAG: hypothetical protein ACI9FW_000561 [Flavobacterium sp.]|jgi:hypothetical protein
MKIEKHYLEEKLVCFNAFQNLNQIEKAIQLIKKQTDKKLQLTVLGKINGVFIENEKNLNEKISKTKILWKNILSDSVDFGSFYTPEIGNVFVAGNLVSTFLHEINGKPLAVMTCGTYSVFRGIGANDKQAISYLKKLNYGYYLLIIRGFDTDIRKLETIIEYTYL